MKDTNPINNFRNFLGESQSKLSKRRILLEFQIQCKADRIGMYNLHTWVWNIKKASTFCKDGCIQTFANFCVYKVAVNKQESRVKVLKKLFASWLFYAATQTGIHIQQAYVP